MIQKLHQERACRLAGLCGQSLSVKAVPTGAAPSFSQVQKNPYAAMQAVLKMCKQQAVPNGFC
jgi:hypothetical protein